MLKIEINVLKSRLKLLYLLQSNKVKLSRTLSQIMVIRSLSLLRYVPMYCIELDYLKVSVSESMGPSVSTEQILFCFSSTGPQSKH